jgi:hypothetical protein
VGLPFFCRLFVRAGVSKARETSALARLAPHPSPLPGGEREKWGASRRSWPRSALSPQYFDALRSSRCMEAEVAKQPGLLSLPCLYSSLCRAPQRHGALRCSRTACRMDRPMPNIEAVKACIQHDATRALEGHFLWVTFLLGQQKKSDSSVGRRSKRPPRRRPGRGRAPIRRYNENHKPRRWIPAYAGMTSCGLR